MSLLRVVGNTLFIDGPGGFASSDEALSTGFRALVRTPGTSLLTDLVEFSGGFAATNGSGKVFFTEDIGVWTAMGGLPVDAYEVIASYNNQLATVGKTARTVEIRTGRKGKWRSAGAIPSSFGKIRQLLWDNGKLTLAASDGIYESDDEGRKWTRIDSPQFVILSLAIRNGRLLVGTMNGLWSKTPGSSWVRVESPGSRPIVTRLRSSGSRLYACTEFGLQETTDFGEHWTESDNLGTVDVADLASWNKNDYAATAKGLFQRSVGSSGWTPLAPSGSFRYIEFADRRWLAVATKEPTAQRAITVFISGDHGANWSEVPPPAGAHAVYSLSSLGGLFFASTDLGVFRLGESAHDWVSIQSTLPHLQFAVLRRYGKQILLAGENKIYALRNADGDADWEPFGLPMSAATPQLIVFDLDAEETSPPLLMAGTAIGLLWRGNNDIFATAISPLSIQLRFSNARSIVELSAPGGSSKRLRFLGTETGVWFLLDDIPQYQGWLGPWNWIVDLYHRYSDEPWFWIVTSLGGLVSAYALAMSALLCSYWLGSNVFVGRSWLISLADKPLQIVPRLGRWALFIRYARRLRARVPIIREVGQNYFGLTARLPSGTVSKPDTTGDILHRHLVSLLGRCPAIIITGKAGAGKSTVLAKLAALALERKLPRGITQMLPVFVSAGHYKSDLLQAISDTLRKRDGLPLDEKGQTVRSQLASGGILVLFDGYSEIEGDKTKALNDMLQVAADPDFARCRFVFGGRPMERFPVEVPIFELQPLELDTVENVYLPCFDLSPNQQAKILAQLRIFSNRPIEPLLLTIAVSDSLSAHPSKTYGALFEKYFKRLLKLEPDQNDKFDAWRYCLENFADWFLLSSGERGVGMPHRSLLDAIAGTGASSSQPLFTQLKRYYRLPVKDELEIVETLASASLLRQDKNWKFAHDAYEEFFAASRLRSSLTNAQPFPISEKWLRNPDQLDEVFSYLREILSEDDRRAIRSSSWPEQWKQAAIG